MGYSGDINIARARAIAGQERQTTSRPWCRPAARRCSSTRWPSRPTRAHPKNAHLFINYILRPEVHASLTNKVFYANPNKASLKFVKKDVAENKTIFLGRRRNWRG